MRGQRVRKDRCGQWGLHARHDGERQVMTWRKLGRIYAPDGRLPWARSHAANPVAEPIENNGFRIYFSSRDDKNRSSIGFVEIDITDPTRVLYESLTPVLGPGDLAMFDDSGTSIG